MTRKNEAFERSCEAQGTDHGAYSHRELAMIIALRKAEQTFRRYGDLHAAKPDPVKAAANYALADEMLAALEAGR